jgi:hypothetical protein
MAARLQFRAHSDHFRCVKREFRQPCEGKAIAMDGAIEALCAG